MKQKMLLFKLYPTEKKLMENFDTDEQDVGLLAGSEQTELRAQKALWNLCRTKSLT